MPERRGPWTVTESREVYRNPFITVREDQAVQENGEESRFGIVEMKPGVSVLPLDDDGHVHLIEVYRFTLDRTMTEAIAGGMDEGETPREAAERELREEAGITAEELIALGVVDQLTEVVSSPNHLFLARRLRFAPANPEGSERITPIKVPLDEAVCWVMEGTITQAASTTLILKAKHYLSE